MKKKSLISASLVAAFTLAVLTSQSVLANSSNSRPMDTIVAKIAQKFNLKEEDVRAVFDQEMADRQREMEANFEKRLDQLVSDGKITSTQKNLILEKHKSMISQRETDRGSNSNLTPDQRKTLMEQRKTELEAWAKENGIDLQHLMPFGKREQHHGPDFDQD